MPPHGHEICKENIPRLAKFYRCLTNLHNAEVEKPVQGPAEEEVKARSTSKS